MSDQQVDLQERVEKLLAEATPGPWRTDDGEGYSQWRIWADTNKLVAHAIGDDAETDANAALIAAAPELLRALLTELQKLREERDTPPVIRAPETEWISYVCKSCGHAPHHSLTVGTTCGVQIVSTTGVTACPCLCGQPPSYSCACRGTHPEYKHHRPWPKFSGQGCTDDLDTDDPNRCKLRDGQSWKCHKQRSHLGACSTHMDCGESFAGIICGKEPGHLGEHSWAAKAELARLRERIVELEDELHACDDLQTPQPTPQTSGGRCRQCGGFTTYTRQNSAKGLCMRCELALPAPPEGEKP